MEASPVAVDDKEFEELRDDVQTLKYQVKDLDYHYKALDLEVKEIKSVINRFDDKLDKTVDKMIEIARDSGARSPKWVIGLTYGVVVTGLLAAVGWVVNAIIFGH